MNCFRYLDFKSLAEVDRLTIPEYNLLIKAQQMKEVDKDYRIHQQAFLNFAVQAKKKVGKNKMRPVYSTFKAFFNYEKALSKLERGKEEGRFKGIGRLLKKGEEEYGGKL